MVRMLMGSESLAALAADAANARLAEWNTPTLRADFHRAFEVATIGTFSVVGHGATRVALLGPDSVVYKAPISREPAFGRECEVFEYAEQAGASWCPDWWPYAEHGVMAMRLYRLCEPGQWHQRDPVVMEMVRVIPTAVEEDCGFAPEGHMVLLDGGAGLPSHVGGGR